MPATSRSPTPAISRRWARNRPMGFGAPSGARDGAVWRAAGLAAL